MAEPRSPASPARRALVLLAATVLVTLAAGPWAAAAPGAPARPDLGRQIADGPQLPPDPDTDPARSRRTADEILDGDEYRAPEEGGRTLLDRIRDWLGDRMPEVSGPGRGASNGLSLLIVAVVGTAALALVAWVVANSRRSRRAADEDDEIDSEVELTPLRTVDEWTAEAERCEAEDDHRGAVRARYRAVTRTLVDRDLVADAPGRTTGELRDDLGRRAPSAAPAFAPLADLFERVWFGSTHAHPDDAVAARRLAEAAVEAAPRRPAAMAGADPASGER